MGGETGFWVNLPSMEVSIFLDFLKSGVGYCHISSISGLALKPYGGSVVLMGILVPVPLVLILSLKYGASDFIIPR